LNAAAAGVLVITGGSSGIGRCTAELFARRGWRVGLIARGAEPLAAACESLRALGARSAFAQADVTDSPALAAAADMLAAELGPIDLWINCAGNGVYGRFSEVPEREFQRVTDVTYHGVVNGTRIALAHMRPHGRGRILNICSAVAFHGLPMMSSYSGAKAAVRAFAQAVAGELKLEGSPIRITSVFPPAANTPFFSHAVSHVGWPARPAWPVYQPEVVAQGVWQAYVNGRAEMTVSGTSAIFSLATRLTPGVIAWCMSKLGIDKQTTRAPEAHRLQEPTLFTPSRRVFGVRGPFNAGARTWSSQLWVERQRTRLLGVLTPRVRATRAPPAAAPQPRPGPPAPCPTLEGLDGQPDAS
jgi:short-subunit dehydrogenase